MSKMVETRDPYTAGHQTKVADLSMAIARELNLPDEHIKYLRIAALIHDIGKIYIPSDILNKPGKLRDMEWELIRIHAQGSYDILKNIEFPWPIAQIALQHHERLDGSGYPNGLAGDQILMEARILAVAEWLTPCHRTAYRPALGIDKARKRSLKTGEFFTILQSWTPA
jgi:putative nucleotidyltransferase with HDIG domain